MSENVNENSPFDEGRKKQKNVEQTKKQEFNEENYLNTRLSDKEDSKTITIRLVLTEDIDGKSKVAIPVEVHSIKLNDKQQRAKTIASGKFKSFICLNDPHLDYHDERGCPLCNKMKSIFDEAAATTQKGSAEWKSMCKQAYKFDSKTAYIARCIERGHEDEGIKFWRFNKRDDGSGILDKLKNMYSLRKSRGIDMFDYQNGFDIILTLSKDPDPTPGAPDKTVISIDADVLPSALADTKEQIDAWVNDPKDWRDMYRSKSYEYLEIVANGESPIWDKSLGKFVEWRDPEELKKEEAETTAKAAAELKDTASTVTNATTVTTVEQESDEELPF